MTEINIKKVTKEVMVEIAKMMSKRTSIWSLDPSDKLNRLVLESELQDEIEVAIDTVSIRHGIKIPTTMLESITTKIFLQVKQALKMS